MSDERERRMLGAGEVIDVNGKEYTLRPVVAQHLSDLEQLALATYKRTYLETYRDNLDLLPPEETEGLMSRKLEEVAGWDLKDLPYKKAFNCSKVPITDRVKEWIEDHFKELPKTDNGIRSVLNTCLDTEMLSPQQVKELTGSTPIEGRVRYDQWWITASIKGMIRMIATSLKQDHPEMGINEVSQWTFPKLAEASRKAEIVSSAKMGNG